MHTQAELCCCVLLCNITGGGGRLDIYHDSALLVSIIPFSRSCFAVDQKQNGGAFRLIWLFFELLSIARSLIPC